MPTYQYSCNQCGHFFEVFQNFSDDSLTTCPECSGQLRKVFNAVGVVFKGSGFYRNDSRGKHSSSDGAASTSSSTSSSNDSGTSSGGSTSSPSASTGSATTGD